jgi:hypothetical protein
MDHADLVVLARRLLTAFSWADLDSMRALLRLPPIACCQRSGHEVVDGRGPTCGERPVLVLSGSDQLQVATGAMRAPVPPVGLEPTLEPF